MFSKKVIVAAALMAAAAAQAQVTVYGHLDAFFGRVDQANYGKATTNVESGIAADSYIGFKGEEDLGGGLKAFFALENGLELDTGSATTYGNFWGRTSELGLKGDFGTAKLGKSLSLGFLANHTYNPFSATGAMSTSQRLNGHGVWSNAITYVSPNMSGFTAAVQLGMSEVNDTDNDIGLQLNYAAGPLGLGFTYSDETDSTKSRWQFGGSYDFGVAKLFGQFGQNKTDGVTDKEKFYQIAVAAPVSAQGAVVASYGQWKQGSAKKRGFAVAYDHTLSKRTGAYVGLYNDYSNANPNDKSGTTFGVGVRHSF
jgi:predicted porin